MKLEVRINGHVVDLKPGSSYELQLNNPMADLKGITGSRGMNLELADSVNNREILGWINDHLSPQQNVKLDCEQYASGNLIDVGYAYVRDARKPVRLDYSSYLSEFFGKYQKMKLSDIDYGLLGASSWNATLSNTWSSGGFVLPTVVNGVFYKESTAPVGWDGKMNSYASGSYVTDTPKVPMFFLKYILKAVGDMAGVSFHGAVWDDAEFGKIFVFNNKTAGLNTERRLHMPDVTVAELLLGLKNWLNVGVFFDVTTKKIRLEYADAKRKAAAVIDWSEKMARLRGGEPVTGTALLLEYAQDSNDGLAKDGFLGSYLSPDPSPQEMGVTNVNSNIVPMVMGSGVLAAAVVGAVDSPGKGNNNVVRVGRWSGAAGTADNSYGSALMSREGMYEAYWAKTDEVNRNTYIVEQLAALDANDLAWVRGVFSGLQQPSPDMEHPIVHVQGADWELLQVTVAFGQSRLNKVRMRRV